MPLNTYFPSVTRYILTSGQAQYRGTDATFPRLNSRCCVFCTWFQAKYCSCCVRRPTRVSSPKRRRISAWLCLEGRIYFYVSALWRGRPISLSFFSSNQSYYLPRNSLYWVVPKLFTKFRILLSTGFRLQTNFRKAHRHRSAQARAIFAIHIVFGGKIRRTMRRGLNETRQITQRFILFKGWALSWEFFRVMLVLCIETTILEMLDVPAVCLADFSFLRGFGALGL